MSPVIKNNSEAPGEAVGKLAALNIANFSDQAQRILIDARTEADRIVTEAKATVEAMGREASETGHAEGYARGVADGQADGAERAFASSTERFNEQTDQLQQMLREMIEQVGQAREQLLIDARLELLEFALSIATKITHVQARDIAAAKGNLGQALQMANCASKIQVKVCPEQLDQLREYATEFVEEMGISSVMTFVPDADLSCGDVILQTRNGEVDGRIQTQLDDIIRVLTGREGDDA